MVTTQRQILEKMVGRLLNDNEFHKLEKISHIEALNWCRSHAKMEGRNPGY